MPAVEQLRDDGVSFSRYIVSNSLCCPSRASILTGKLPHNSLVRTNLPPFGGYSAFMGTGNAFSTFGTSLTAAGYRTGLLGKFLNGYLATRDAPLPGFAEWQASAAGYRQYNYTLNVNGEPERFGHAPSDFLNGVLKRRGLSFIRRATDENVPFMLKISSFSPHSPFVYAPRDRGRFPNARAPRRGAYDVANDGAPEWLAGHLPLRGTQKFRLDGVYRKRVRSVLSVDRLLASVREELELAGVADNTYVIFSSDNGFHIGEHRLLAGKQTAFDHDIRVPLIIAGPGVPAGRVSPVLAQNTDLRPTFEAMAGLAPSPDVDGMSLMPWLRDPLAPGGRVAAIVEHKKEPSRPYADPDAQTRESGNPPDYVALRLPESTYVEYSTGEREYYNLLTDPHELHNVYATLPVEARLQLEEQVQRLRTCRGVASCVG
jgi:arylsulfatase A-like enzyme